MLDRLARLLQPMSLAGYLIVASWWAGSWITTGRASPGLPWVCAFAALAWTGLILATNEPLHLRQGSGTPGGGPGDGGGGGGCDGGGGGGCG